MCKWNSNRRQEILVSSRVYTAEYTLGGAQTTIIPSPSTSKTELIDVNQS